MLASRVLRQVGPENNSGLTVSVASVQFWQGGQTGPNDLGCLKFHTSLDFGVATPTDEIDRRLDLSQIHIPHTTSD